jgi:hypothetical protein
MLRPTRSHAVSSIWSRAFVRTANKKVQRASGLLAGGCGVTPRRQIGAFSWSRWTTPQAHLPAAYPQCRVRLRQGRSDGGCAGDVAIATHGETRIERKPRLHWAFQKVTRSIPQPNRARLSNRNWAGYRTPLAASPADKQGRDLESLGAACEKRGVEVRLDFPAARMGIG